MFDGEMGIIVQGITGNQGSFHSKLMKDYGTNVLAGVTPGKGGQEVGGLPVYNSVKECIERHDANFSAIFVPAKFAKSAALEALENGLNIVIITEGVPIHDSLDIVNFARYILYSGTIQEKRDLVKALGKPMYIHNQHIASSPDGFNDTPEPQG